MIPQIVIISPSFSSCHIIAFFCVLCEHRSRCGHILDYEMVVSSTGAWLDTFQAPLLHSGECFFVILGNIGYSYGCICFLLAAYVEQKHLDHPCAFLLREEYCSIICSYTASSCERFKPNDSNAPAFMREAIIRLFIPQERFTKSSKELKGPFFLRSSIICSNAAKPTFLIANIPIRISSP